MILQILTNNSDIEDAITVASFDEANKLLGTNITDKQVHKINQKIFEKKSLTKTEQEWVTAREKICKETYKKVMSFVQYDSFYIDFDLDKNTATVCP